MAVFYDSRGNKYEGVGSSYNEKGQLAFKQRYSSDPDSGATAIRNVYLDPNQSFYSKNPKTEVDPLTPSSLNSLGYKIPKPPAPKPTNPNNIAKAEVGGNMIPAGQKDQTARIVGKFPMGNTIPGALGAPVGRGEPIVKGDPRFESRPNIEDPQQYAGTGTGTAATQYEKPFGYEDINYTLKRGQTLSDFIRETEAQLDKIKKIPSHKRTRAQKALMQTHLPRVLAKARYDLQESGNTDMAKKITTDAQLEQRMADLAGGLSTGVPQVTAVRPEVAQNELQGTGNVILGEGTTTATAQTPTQAMPTVPTGTEGVGQISGIERTAPSVTTMDTAQITPTGDYMQGVQGTVSPEAVATAQTEELDKRGTVQYQMTQLMSALEEGGEMPPWASPAVRKVGAVMQARGLGASSMASAAITQAVMESGIAIAAQDANKYSTIQLQNLNNKQQTALANAATYAAMDKANLSARLQSAVTNAQSLLSVDTANLTAQQQTNTLNFNALTQAMFKDAAEENARREFNAKNELQVQEFFAELGSQVETANANRTAAINQFNVGEANAMNQFNASMQDARDKFNSNMQYAIDQSNVNWRRQVNTADTAIQNETNRINVQNLFNMNQSALNALWQKYRDNAAWNFQKSESALQRQHEIGIMAMEFANSKETYTQQQKDSIGIGVGNWLATWAAM
jgi:hypothetical protein